MCINPENMVVFGLESSSEDKYEIVLNVLQNIPGSNLLVIDGATREITDYDEKLPGYPNWNILLTSREKLRVIKF